MTFHATGPDGTPVYHTNVALAIGSRCVAVCADAVAEAERGALLERLAAGGRCVETIGIAQMMNFAGNVLETAQPDWRERARDVGASLRVPCACVARAAR